MKTPELTGQTIALRPIDDSHFQVLQDTVLQHPDIYRYTTIGNTPADFARWFALAQQQNAWVVVRLSDNQAVGSTRLYQLNESVRAVTMGYTWYAPDCRGTGINDEAKLLVLSYIFETLQLNRVTFEVHGNNVASRRAVEKLGAELEGVLKQHRRGSDGNLDDTCIYALFADNWQQTKTLLKEKTGIK